MSVTIEHILQCFPETKASEWHQHKNGGGWVQKTAHVEESARVYGDALVYYRLHIEHIARISKVLFA